MVAAPSEISRVLAAKTHYSVLNVSVEASAAEIKSAFRQLSLSLHPDKCSAPQSEAAFQRVSEAHIALGDALQRRVYDYELEQRSSRGAARESRPAHPVEAQQHAPVVNKPPAPHHWRSAEEIKASADAVAAIEIRELTAELSQHRQQIMWERGQERERCKRHELELTQQKRMATEARAERDKLKSHWEGRLAHEKHLHDRSRSEADARIELLRKQLANEQASAQAARAEAAALSEALRVLVLHNATSKLAESSGAPSPPPPPTPLPPSSLPRSSSPPPSLAPLSAKEISRLLEPQFSEARRLAVLQLEDKFRTRLAAEVERRVRERCEGVAAPPNADDARVGGEAVGCSYARADGREAVGFVGCSWAPTRLGGAARAPQVSVPELVAELVAELAGASRAAGPEPLANRKTAGRSASNGPGEASGPASGQASHHSHQAPGATEYSTVASGKKGGSSGSQPPTTTLSIEKDAHGNFVVVEKDVKGAYTVSSGRHAAQERWAAPSGGVAGGHSAGSRCLGGTGGAIPIGGAATPTGMSESLLRLLEQLGLSHFRGALEDEDIRELALIRSMGAMLETNLLEIGMDAGSIARLRAALRM